MKCFLLKRSSDNIKWSSSKSLLKIKFLQKKEENYHLVYQWRRKVEIHRDTGVSKKTCWNILKKERYREGGKDKRGREREWKRDREWESESERERGERRAE